MLLLIPSWGGLSAEPLYDNLKYDIMEIILAPQGGKVIIRAEVADNQGKRMLGLMHRKYLAPEAGMLFIFENEQVRTFWMKNTLIPLDMIFISNELQIKDIIRNADPCEYSPCITYSSFHPVKYVLEINGGLSEKMGLKPGDSVELHPAASNTQDKL
jgi:uncharacterized membrane protein (UPF0127 family)